LETSSSLAKKDGGCFRRNGLTVSALIRSESDNGKEQFWGVLNFPPGQTDGAGICGKIWKRKSGGHPI
jgi:hypothetical protein